MYAASGDRAKLQDEVTYLELALERARIQLKSHDNERTLESGDEVAINHVVDPSHRLLSSPHALLLLSDSALPLGSFAFSSGLESYLAHHRPRPPFAPFLALSMASLASLTLPYLLAAYRSPSSLLVLDNDLDASTPCTVARRASVAQGRALLGVWERALESARPDGEAQEPARKALCDFSLLLKSTTLVEIETPPNGHFAPIWALVCRLHGLSLRDTAYVFLFGHAKAVLSAAVRASVMGPYQAQGVLASRWLEEEIGRGMEMNWDVEVAEAGQRVPVLDLWVGRHELLYSRIFNS